MRMQIGDDFEMNADPCPKCHGLTVLSEPVAVKRTDLLSGEVSIIRAEPGDQCPICLGRGMIGRASAGCDESDSL